MNEESKLSNVVMNEAGDEESYSHKNGGESAEEETKRGHLAFLDADIYQAATLNKLLPPGFKIEAEDVVKRSYLQKQAALKKAA
jgi:hypothetical protein